MPVATLLDKPLTRGCLPAPPTGIVVNSVDPHTLRLNWTAPASTERVVSYDLYRQGRMFTRISRLGIDDAGLEAGTEYCYDVRSRNLDGNVSVAGTPVCRTTRGLDTAAPSVPTLQAITPLSTTAMRVSWAASGDDSAVSGYTVLVNGVAVRSVADTKVDILRLNAGTQYCFKVRAYDSSGNFSADSAQACGVTLPPALAAWTMLLRCADRPDYVVSKGIDIDLQAPNNVSVAGQAVDYTGTLMSYHLFGGYDSTVGILLGKIDWTFANSSNVREDDFSLRLQTADTGDVPMTQVKVAGCNATIRLKRN